MNRYGYIFTNRIDCFSAGFKSPSRAKTILRHGYDKVEQVLEEVMALAERNKDYILTDTTSDHWKRLLNRYLDKRACKIKELARMPRRTFEIMSDFSLEEQLFSLEVIFENMPEGSYESIGSVKSSIWGTMVLPWTYFSALTSKMVGQGNQLVRAGQSFGPKDFLETYMEFMNRESRISGDSISNSIFLNRKTFPGSFESGK